MYRVTKRDGEITDFNLSKISIAIEKAFKAQEKNFLVLYVTYCFPKELIDRKPQEGGDLRDSQRRGFL